MTISAVTPIPVGNALKIFLQPPDDAQLWRVLRNTTGAFVDENDPSASVIYQGDQQRYLVDTCALLNGTAYSYCAFYLSGGAWTPSNVLSGTPAATYADQSTDVLSVVRDRIEAGLQVEVARGVLFPTSGQIEVLNAPPAFEDARWPLVTVHVANDGSGDRAIGESIGTDDFNPFTNTFGEGEGWLARVQLTIVGWSKNSDERIELRKVLRRLVIANLSVFDSFGMDQIDISQSDSDLISNELPAPVFQTVCTLSCLAPAFVTSDVGLVSDVSSTAVPFFPPA